MSPSHANAVVVEGDEKEKVEKGATSFQRGTFFGMKHPDLSKIKGKKGMGLLPEMREARESDAGEWKSSISKLSIESAKGGAKSVDMTALHRRMTKNHQSDPVSVNEFGEAATLNDLKFAVYRHGEDDGDDDDDDEGQ